MWTRARKQDCQDPFIFGPSELWRGPFAWALQPAAAFPNNPACAHAREGTAVLTILLACTRARAFPAEPTLTILTMGVRNVRIVRPHEKRHVFKVLAFLPGLP
jgi:hypothetical protein